MGLGTAVLRVQLDTQGLRSGLQIARQDVSGFVNTSEARLRQVGRSFAQGFVVAQAAVTAMGGALVLAANRAAQYADEVDKAALRTRLSTSTVQELRFVTDQLGGSFGAVETAVQGLTQRLAGAEAGGDRQAAAFQRLGVALRNANGELRSTEELFFDSLGALQGLTNETERAVLATEVFGRSAAQLGPILSAGAGSVEELRARARELGIVLDGDSIRQLVAYKDQLSELQQQFGGITRELSLQFLPILTQNVLPAVQRALQVFQALPEPLQRAAAGFTALGVGAAGAATALRLLGLPIASLFGPAGLIIAGGAAVAVLATSLIGGRTSLAGAAEEAQRALAGGDKGGFVGALDKLIERSDAGARPALERLRQDLIQTGDVSIEQAARIVAAVSQFQLQNRNFFGLETRGQLELQLTLIGNRAGQDFVSEYEAALNNLDFDRAAGVLESAIAAAVDTGVRRGDLERLQPVLADLREFIASVADLPSGFRDPGTITGAASTAAAAGVPGAVSLPSQVRALETVFTELGQAGARSVATTDRLIRAGVDESEARTADLQNRLALLTRAQGEVLRDFYDEVTDAQLAYLVERIRQVQGELAALLAGAEPPALAGLPAGAVAGARAAASAPFAADAAAIRADTETAQALAAAAERAERVEFWLNQAAGNARDQAAALAINRDTQTAIANAAEAEREARLAAWRAQIGVNAELQAQAAAIRADTSEAQAPRAIPIPQAQVTLPAPVAVGGFQPVVSVDQEALARARAREAREEERAQRIARINQRAAEAFRLSGENLLAFTQRVVNDPRSGTVPIPVPEVVVDVGDAPEEIDQAARDFRDQVVLAGAQFSAGLIDSIRSGDVRGAVQNAFSAVGAVANAGASFLGAAKAGTTFLGMGAAAIPGLNLFAGLIPILGGFFASLLPGSSQRDEETERAAAAQRARSVPSIQVIANINQTNNISEGINTPSTQATLDQRIQNAIRAALEEVGLADIRAAAFGSPA